MPQKSQVPETENIDFDKSELLQPENLIVNYSEKHSILMDNNNDKYYYSRIINASNAILKEMFSAQYPYYSKKITDKQWTALTDTKCIQLKYEQSVGVEAFRGLLGINNNLLNGVGSINDIIISPDNDKTYIADLKNDVYYEFTNDAVSYNKLDSLINEISDKTMLSGIFLNRLYQELASIDFIIPTDFVSTEKFPEYSLEKELDVDKNLSGYAALFFNDVSVLSKVRDSDGTVAYYDREGASIKIDPNGRLEYVRYDLSTQNEPDISLEEALNISNNFVKSHLDFPAESYITGVQSNSQGNRYVITYNYKYNGVPLKLNGDEGSNAIEVELVGRDVKSYRRLVRKVTGQLKQTQLRPPISILDVVFNESYASGESIVKMSDMRIEYMERKSQGSFSLMPVWIVDVTTAKKGDEKESKENRSYVINAETGLIIGK